MALRSAAYVALAGVGEGKDILEWTGYAFHLRRRLTAAEQAIVGDVVDCRGTDEWQRRFDAIKARLPEIARRMALEENREWTAKARPACYS